MNKKRTKIVCTIGPASDSVKTLTALVQNGMNVARLNFSHNTHESHAQVMANVRTVSRKLKQPIAIIQDLQGPKVRVSKMDQPLPIKAGQKLVIGQDFSMDFDISGSAKKGDRILIEDGLTELEVLKVVGKKIHTKVKNTGTGKIISHKGINLPDTQIRERVFTDKDVDDLKFGVKQDVDYIAISFIRNASDVVHVRKLIQKYTPKKFTLPKIIVKLEVAEAVKNFDEILAVTDGIMVARGDLGVEIDETRVPVAQKMMIEKCRQAAKPVIVATQMLDSMIRNPRPTRAEVTDVASAVMDKVDAVMLSGESAFGAYPVEAVSTMNKIIRETEASEYVTAETCEFVGDEEGTEVALLADSVAYLAENNHTAAIIAGTETGFTGRFLSQPRPHVPIIMLTENPTVMRQMVLLWGVTPMLLNTVDRVLSYLEKALATTKKTGLVKKGDKVVLVTGNPIGRRVNLIEVKTVA